MPNTGPRLVATGDIRPSRFVKMSGENQGAEGSANAVLIGIAMESSNYPPLTDLVTTAIAAASGEYFKLYGDGDECLVEAGAAVTAGLRLKSDSVGRAVVIATSGGATQQVGAVALESAAAVGDLIRVQVQLGAEEAPA